MSRKDSVIPYKTINGIKDRISRHVMTEYLQRPLQKGEHVYHIDGDVKNNSIENLIVIKKSIR